MKKKENYYQMLRALAIIAVILIHSCKDSRTSSIIIFRQFINYSVALFIFLSGYLTTFNSVKDVNRFYKKRLIRIGIPYIIWSIAYTIIDKNFTVFLFIKNFLTGQCCGIYYYLIVYMQLVLLTPFLLRTFNKNYYKIIWMITPITVVLEYIFAINGHAIEFPFNVLSFLTWIIFYYYGLYLRNIKPLNKNINKNISLYILFLIASIAEGFMWNANNYNDIAISQIKITSILASIYFINVLLNLKDRIKENKILVQIGNLSFGIYLIHLLSMKITYKIYKITINPISDAIIMGIITLSISCVVILCCRYILKDKSKIVGF